MAITYKVLGQVAPSATTNTTLYTVPSATQVVVSSIVIANRGASATIRIAVRPNGDALANQHYIVYDSQIEQANTLAMSLGLTLDASDVITVYASTANVTFSAYGSEIA